MRDSPRKDTRIDGGDDQGIHERLCFLKTRSLATEVVAKSRRRDDVRHCGHRQGTEDGHFDLRKQHDISPL